MDWIKLEEDDSVAKSCKYGKGASSSIKGGEFFDSLSNYLKLRGF
jgi:hypothetical protein